MRILFLTPEYPPRLAGGVGARVSCLARSLAPRGHEVHVLALMPGEAPSDVLEDGVLVHRRPSWSSRPSLRWLSGSRRRLFNSFATLRQLTGFRPGFDLIETIEGQALALLPALLSSHPLVVCMATPHHMLAQHRGSWGGADNYLADRFERVLVRKATAILSPSRLLARSLRANGWLGDRSVEVIPHAIDAETWLDVGPTSVTARSILFIGRVERRKGPEMLLRAAAILLPDYPDLELVYAGRAQDGHGDFTRREAARLGLRCRFVGHVDRPELRTLFGHARVVAVPSLFDSFSMAALEAMCAARPVVCTSTTGAGELIAGTEAGAVVPPGDPQALAEALRPYLADLERAARAGEAARKLALLHCGPTVIAKERERVYQLAIDRWRGGRGKV